MSLQLLKFQPGIVKDITEYAAGKSGPFWVDADLIRFRNGYPTKIGGWLADIYNALNADGSLSTTPTTIEGIARRMIPWRSNEDGKDRIVVSTHNHLYIIQDSGLYDITPLRDKTNATTTTTEALDNSETEIDLTSVTGFKTAGVIKIGSEIITYTGISTLTLTGCTRGTNSTSAAAHDSGATVTQVLIAPIATADESTTVTITDSGHGALKGDFVVFDGAVATGGISANTLNRRSGYQITAVATNTFTITVPSAATSTVSAGGGNVIVINYLIGAAAGLGIQSADPALGWGVGAWGDSTWGTARTQTESNVGLESSCWSLNIWDADVLCQVRGGALYYWDTSNGVTNRAELVSDESDAKAVPTVARVLSISFPDRHVICGGADAFVYPDSTTGTLDPMLVRWSTQESFSIWNPDTDNTAGDQRLEIGTKIVAIVPTREETIISTDQAIYGMSFVGAPLTFQFRLLATDAGASGINTMINVDSTIYWMGKNSFYQYNGQVQEMPCPVQYYVFDRMRKNYQDKTVCGHNKKFKEVTWFYPSEDGADQTNPEPDSYVTYNYAENAWTIGTMDRTVWSDSFGFREVPFAFDKGGNLYNHETGTTDNGSAMNSFVESSPRELTDGGENLYLVDKIIPDVTLTSTTNLYVELNTRKYPNASEVTKGPFTITSTTQKLSTRAKGRQMSIKIYSSGTEDTWSLGDFRINARKDSLR